MRKNLEEEKPKPNEEQTAILDCLRKTDENILINSPAGGGKTTLLEMMAAATNVDKILYLCFNKSIADEAREKFPPKVEVRTLNSLGNSIWRGAVGAKIVVDGRKSHILLKEEINALKGQDRREASDSYWDIITAVGMAKHLGYVPAGKFPDAKRLVDQSGLCARLENKLSPLSLEIIDSVLFSSIKASYAGSIDFDDQIYMPALFGGSFPRFPLILVDEDQDLSPANHALLDKLCKDRVCAVGDRWQSIYGFRGADTNSVDKLKRRFNMKEMILTYSFRCPQAIVEAARWRVPHMRWIKEGGYYGTLRELGPMDIPDGSAILCRNNAPLFRSAFALLSGKRSVSVAGSDIGPKIVRLLQKVGSPGDSREDLLFKIAAWREEKLQSSNSPATTNDQADCMEVFAGWGTDFNQAISYAEYIFSQKGTIHLTTGHKAKGREWNTVYHLDPDLCRNDDQDLNLKYVITTRSKDRLFEITSRDLQW
jgi:superfamily I DNA/RNA helicase